ncbi:MAG: type II toxin-antitoxin system HicA family toxin [Clostridia bacterium]|nr:type II toxin-antitoxin system HicA family toxin [Clostridia bacterium]
MLWDKKKNSSQKLKSNPKAFTFDDAESLLGYFTIFRSDKGKTSGSRVMFTIDKYNAKILLHKPHPRKELLEYQVRQLVQQLEQEGLI